MAKKTHRLGIDALSSEEIALMDRFACAVLPQVYATFLARKQTTHTDLGLGDLAHEVWLVAYAMMLNRPKEMSADTVVGNVDSNRSDQYNEGDGNPAP